MLNGFLLRVAPCCLACIMRLWFLTCRTHLHNGAVLEEKRDTPLIGSFWHYSIIYLFYHMRKHSVTAMVSASRDGEYIAGVAERFGFNTIRGSRNSRGVGALKGMLRAVRSGSNAAIVADGSQGPPRKAQPGAILVASRTGAVVVPMAWSASSYFVIRSWDRTVIPRPFSRIDLFLGDPLVVPRDLDTDGLESYRILLEENLNDLYCRAWALHGKSEH